MPITPLPDPPLRSMLPPEFIAAADAFMASLPGFATEANALEEDLNNLVSAAFTTTSVTSLLIGTGTKSLTVQAGLGFAAGQTVIIARTSASANRMVGTVTSYNAGTGALVVSVGSVGGAGTFTDWTVSLAPAGTVTAFIAGLLDDSDAAAARATLDAFGATGTTTNDNAAAGKVAEYLESEVLSGSAVSLVSATAKDVTSLSLTAGDWEVWGEVVDSATGVTTWNLVEAWIGTVSNTAPVLPNKGAYQRLAATLSISTQALSAGRRRFSLSATTTVYLGTQVNFSGGSMVAYGILCARRVR